MTRLDARSDSVHRPTTTFEISIQFLFFSDHFSFEISIPLLFASVHFWPSVVKSFVVRQNVSPQVPDLPSLCGF